MRTKKTTKATTTTRVDGSRKYFIAVESNCIMRAHTFTGAGVFWRLERETSLGWRPSVRALAILTELGRQLLAFRRPRDRFQHFLIDS
jgi:hypothetical protein